MKRQQLANLSGLMKGYLSKNEMEEGDSVYLDATVPHTGKSLGNKKAKLLAVLFDYKRL